MNLLFLIGFIFVLCILVPLWFGMMIEDNTRGYRETER
jgi:hypothetical protein